MKKLFLIFLLCSGQLCFGQKGVFIDFSTGWGFYKCTKLKQINNHILNLNKYSPRIISNMPSYPYFGGSIGFAFPNKSLLSLDYGYNSTGSRVSVKDYSGSIRFDIMLHAHTFGLSYEKQMFECKNFVVNAKLAGGMEYTSLKMTENIRITDKVKADSVVPYHGTNNYLEPGLSVCRRYGSFLFKAELSYYMNFKIDLFASSTHYNADVLRTSQYYVTYPNYNYIGFFDGSTNPTQLSVQWSGLRCGVSISFFPFKHKQEKAQPKS